MTIAGQLNGLRKRQQQKATEEAERVNEVSKQRGVVWDQITRHAPGLADAMLQYKDFFAGTQSITVITEEGQFKYEMPNVREGEQGRRHRDS